MRWMGRLCTLALPALIWLLVGCGGGGGSGGRTIDIEVLELSRDLVSGNATFPQGRRISLPNIIGGVVADPHPPTCNDRHLHAADPARGIEIQILFTAVSFPDPDPNGCGYGRIVTETFQEPDDYDFD